MRLSSKNERSALAISVCHGNHQQTTERKTDLLPIHNGESKKIKSFEIEAAG